jgi:hypothetical protein
MHARIDDTRLSLFGACAAPCKCIVGTMLLLLSLACLADARVVPRLFGAVAAIVIGCERSLCAARSLRRGAVAAWIGVACAWLALASCMLHSFAISAASLRGILIVIIAASALCRFWIDADRPSSGREGASRWLVAAGVSIQVAILFAAALPALAGIASAIAVELALIGSLGLVPAAAEFRDLRRVHQRVGAGAAVVLQTVASNPVLA